MNWELLIDLHKSNDRQGPGSEEQTKMAITLSGLSCASEILQVADIGCGTGASTLVLAENLNANITAVDLFPEFLSVLTANAEKQGLADKIRTLACSMDDLPFEEGSLDAIWAEGAVYNMGFKKSVTYFKRFLKPGGILAASEITWLTQSRPDEIRSYWDNEYPEIATAADKIRVLEEQGFILKGYFPLPVSCWIDNYYDPLRSGFDAFLAKHDTEEAKEVIDAETNEITLYEKYRNYYSYGFYIARKS
ncbi:MAG: methyltransferase domain-containing protein [Candidatus Dadabacteria bacterium]|nr:methyltransferase domain-containing protein [Candidatus Dadabacteria bacterium]MDE0477966.1 methyltransferase domain-containing protein [Candidatus Dadabacteria bacterium]